jgi:hypothetical protein
MNLAEFIPFILAFGSAAPAVQPPPPPPANPPTFGDPSTTQAAQIANANMASSYAAATSQTPNQPANTFTKSLIGS